jgi:DNA-binding CsgD family transcriptional regulator/GAF domain-containing protein
MASAYAMERAVDRIADLAGRGHDLARFLDGAAEAVGSVIDTDDAICFYTFDPASLLMTSSYSVGFQVPEEMIRSGELGFQLAAMMEFELNEELNGARAVATNPNGIQTLHEVTGGDLEKSWAYQVYYQPKGLEQELLLAMRTSSGETWGSMTLARAKGRPLFDSTEMSFLKAVAPHLAQGVKRGLLVGEAADPEGPDAPGLVVLDQELHVESLSPGVEQRLATLPGFGELDSFLPLSLLAVATQAQSLSRGGAAPGEVAMARVLARDGQWCVLHGVPLAGKPHDRTAVIIEPAGPARIIPLLMLVYGLTPREQELTRRVLAGDSTTEIARGMYVSPRTVQQHLKSIFEKTGVRSRRELVGKVFFNHYDPRIMDNLLRMATAKPIRGNPFPISVPRSH